MPPETILTATGICHSFGGLMALEDVDFQIKRKEIVSLIGPNGAGKTTLFNLFTGHYNPTRGEIYFNNRKINGLKPYQVTPIGIARTFQNIRLFGQMSVLENVLVGQHCRTRSGLFDAILRTRGFRQEEREPAKWPWRCWPLSAWKRKRTRRPATSPTGSSAPEMARALATNPSLLLLDEPAAGMNPRKPPA